MPQQPMSRWSTVIRVTVCVFFVLFLPLAIVAPAGAQVPTPVEAQVPTPESVLGFQPGADFKLADYRESIEYFRRLDAASDRLRLVQVGRTSRGQPWYLALISSPANLANLERYREIAQRIAHPAGLTDAEARALASEGRAFVDISGGLHATEVAGAQHTIQLAYNLVGSQGDPRTAAILDEVVLLLWPSLNPDGQDIVAHWYRQNVGTRYETAPLHELYQEYIGHDNNRDGYMLNVPESRVVTHTWRHWEPQIIYVHHQSSPFPTRIWLPPFASPIAPRSPALIIREVNAIGMLIAQELESRGQEGATHRGTGYDAWYPGYIDYLPVLQNIASFWTETALFEYATPHFYELGDFPEDARDFRTRAIYVSPWKGGWWRLRDAVEYMVTASYATLDYAAKFREQLLYNRYQAGRNTIRYYESHPPFAYVVPRAQRDPMAAVALLRRLAFNGVRVYRLARAAPVNGESYPAGTWVIPMNQSFADMVRQLMEVQDYPDLREYPEGPPEQPYDAAGWTLPYLMDIRVVAAKAPLSPAFRDAMRPVRGDPIPWQSSPTAAFRTHPVAAGVVPPPGDISGSGPALAVNPAETNSYRLINRALAAGGTVRFNMNSSIRFEDAMPERPVTFAYGPGGAAFGAVDGADDGVDDGADDGVDGGALRGKLISAGARVPADVRAGQYVVSGVDDGTLEDWVNELALHATRVEDDSGVPVDSRIGIYRSWNASIDEGWTRWVLDRFEFEYERITNADIQAGGLWRRYDVIVLASMRPRTLLNGYSEGSVPPRYAGGIGASGVRQLDAFIRSGGTLVCLNRSSAFAIEQFHLPVRNVLEDLDRDEFFASGSILEVITDPAHPIMAGMPVRASVFVDGSPAFTTLEGFEGAVLARYADAGSPLMSGYLLGHEHLQGYAAAVDVRHGAGHVVLIGFRPQWRGQTFGTFRILLNAVLFGGVDAARAFGTSGFWEAPARETDAAEPVTE